MNPELVIRIKQVIESYAEISMPADGLNFDESLFAHGMSSRASVSVMLGLESEFDIEFPEPMLKRENFENLRNIYHTVESLISPT